MGADPTSPANTTGNAAIQDLRDQIHRELELRRQCHQAVHAEQAKALEVAYDSLTYRLEGMNEFRHTMSDQAARFPTRSETAALFAACDERLRQLGEAVQKLELSHSNLQARLYTIFAVVTVGMAAVNILLAVFR